MIDLRFGDCLELMKDIPDGSVDMILCDLPYGTTACKWDTVIPFAPLWEQYKRVIKKSGAIVLTGTQPFSSALGASNLPQLRYSWTWAKAHTGQLNAKKMPLKNAEDILVFYDTQPSYNPQFSDGSPYSVSRKGYKGSEAYGAQADHSTVSDGKRYPMQIVAFGPDANRTHPTQKPVALMEYLIRTYTNDGETVLDNCMGSGTTGVACVNTNRHFIGIEQDPDYFVGAVARIGGTRP